MFEIDFRDNRFVVVTSDWKGAEILIGTFDTLVAASDRCDELNGLKENPDYDADDWAYEEWELEVKRRECLAYLDSTW